MRKLIALISSMLLLVALMALPSAAAEHEHDHDVPEHPHVLLLNFEFNPDDGSVDFDRCIDLAANRELPLNAHHHSVHVGTAGFGDPSVGLTRAGHAVVPMQPFPESPFEDCEDVVAFANA